MMACVPCRPMTAWKRRLISASAASQEIRSNSPRPFGPAQRIEHAIRTVDALLVILDLYTEAAARERMLRIAANAHHAAIPDRGHHGAGVGTVMWTGAQDTSLIHAKLPSCQIGK